MPLLVSPFCSGVFLVHGGEMVNRVDFPTKTLNLVNFFSRWCKHKVKNMHLLKRGFTEGAVDSRRASIEQLTIYPSWPIKHSALEMGVSERWACLK